MIFKSSICFIYCPSIASEPLLECIQWWKTHHSYNSIIRKSCSIKFYPNQPKWILTSTHYSYFFFNLKFDKKALFHRPLRTIENLEAVNPKLKSGEIALVLLNIATKMWSLDFWPEVTALQVFAENNTYSLREWDRNLSPGHNWTPHFSLYTFSQAVFAQYGDKEECSFHYC